MVTTACFTLAFEADDVGSGWSVTAVGHARQVTDPADIDKLRTTGPRPWVPDELPYFVRITPGMLNGRWLTSADNAPAGPDAVVPPIAR